MIITHTSNPVLPPLLVSWKGMKGIDGYYTLINPKHSSWPTRYKSENGKIYYWNLDRRHDRWTDSRPANQDGHLFKYIESL